MVKDKADPAVMVLSWLAELEQLDEILDGDASECLKQAEASDDKGQDSQFWRRMYVRTVFARIEGIVYCMKQIALEAAKLHDVELPPAETALLLEHSYELNDKGVVKTRTKFINLKQNVPFTFKAYAHAHNIDYSLKLDRQFDEAIQIRNRLTHPKGSNADTLHNDIFVTDDEFSIVCEASLWFDTVFADILQRVNEGITTDTDDSITH